MGAQGGEGAVAVTGLLLRRLPRQGDPMNVNDAIALAGQPDWRLTLESWKVGRSGELAPGVEVWTSYLPVRGDFETLVVDHTPSRRTDAFPYRSRTLNVWDAMERHATVTQQLRQFLADQEMV
jgi:hypothetical protein